MNLFEMDGSNSESESETLLDIEEDERPPPKIPKLSMKALMQRKEEEFKIHRENLKRLKAHREILENKEKNPLLNPEIVTKICQFLSFNQLLEVRTINKIWSSSAIRDIKKRHRILAFQPDELDRFTGDMLKTLEFPYGKFKIDYISSVNAIMRFFRSLGTHVSNLVLDYRRADEDREIDSSTFEQIIRYIKNIKQLELNCLPPEVTSKPIFTADKSITAKDMLYNLTHLRFVEESEMCYSVGFLQDLFLISPNCNSIYINSVYDPVILSRFFTSIKRFTNKSTLANLHITTRISEIQLEQCKNVGFKLKSLRLDDVSLNYNPDLLKTFIESQSETLEKLHICLTATSSQVGTFDMPVMNALKNLTIYNVLELYENTHIPIPITRNPNVNEFPNLEKLTTTGVVLNQFLGPTMGNFYMLRELDIKINPPEEADGLMERISYTFPHLKSLTIYMTNGTIVLPTVFGLYEELEFLSIEYYGQEDVNALLAGISTNRMSDVIKYMSDRNNICDEGIQKFIDTLRPQKSLRNMTGLKTLKIFSKYSEMNEVAAYFGLLRIPSLIQLFLHNINVSSSCLESICKHHQYVEVQDFMF